MKLTEADLLFIHDKAKQTLPYIKILINLHEEENKYAKRKAKQLNALRLKTRKELNTRFNVSLDYIDSDER